MKLQHLSQVALGTALLLALGSCNNDLPEVAPQDGNVRFTAKLANVPGTRAFSDGNQAVNLTVRVFKNDAGKLKYIKEETAVFNNLKASVDIALLKDVDYELVFFAARGNSVYSLTTPEYYNPDPMEFAELNVDYSKMNLLEDGNYNDDDCFLNVLEYKGGSAQSTDVTLKRPVAQLNIGSDDQTAKAITKLYTKGITTKVTVPVYSQMNLLSGEVMGDKESVTFTMAYNDALAAETFPVTVDDSSKENYKYLSMSYLMIDPEGQIEDVKIENFNGADATPINTLTVPNVPLKRNNRTNIFGSLLTDKSNWNISIDSEWEDGEPYKDDTQLSQGGTVKVEGDVETINIPSVLDSPLTLLVMGNVGTINVGATSQPVTVKVAKDIDYPAFVFEKGSTIKDFTIVGDPESSKALSGFNYNTDITLSRPDKFENLTFEGCTFKGHGFEPQYAVSFSNVVIKDCKFLEMMDAAVAMQITQSSTDHLVMENLTIDGCQIEMSADCPASKNGLYLCEGTGKVTVKNTTIKNATYHGIFIVGRAGYSTNVELIGNTIENVKKDGVKIENLKNGYITIAGNKITGQCDNGIRLKNSVEKDDITITGNKFDMVNAPNYNESDGENSAILLFNFAENATPVHIVVKENEVANSNGHDLTMKNINQDSTSETSNPTK